MQAGQAYLYGEGGDEKAGYSTFLPLMMLEKPKRQILSTSTVVSWCRTITAFTIFLCLEKHLLRAVFTIAMIFPSGKAVLEPVTHAGVLVTDILLAALRPLLTSFDKKGPGCKCMKFLFVLVFYVTFCISYVASARPNPDFYAHTDPNTMFPPAAFP